MKPFVLFVVLSALTSCENPALRKVHDFISPPPKPPTVVSSVDNRGTVTMVVIPPAISPSPFGSVIGPILTGIIHIVLP